MIRLDIKHTSCGASEGEILSLRAAAESANTLLHTGEGAGNDFLGRVNHPSSITAEEITAIKATAARLAEKAEVIIVIGIGGSYLGAKAVLDAMSSSFHFLHKERKNPYIVFAGNNLSETYTAELLEATKEYSIAAIVISKSGPPPSPQSLSVLSKPRLRLAMEKRRPRCASQA